MIVGRLKRALSRALVGVTTATRAYPRAEWSTVLEPESAEFRDVVAPPFAPLAQHLDPARYVTPRAISAPINDALYYSYLNVIVTPRRRILLDTDNTYQEHPENSAAEKFYWRNLYFEHIEEIPGVSFALRSPANNFYHTLADNLPRLYALHQPRYRDTSIALLVPGALQPFEEHFLTNLLPQNVRIRRVEHNRLQRLDVAILSSYLSRQMSGYLPRKYLAFFLERALPSRPRQKRNRIYVTRRPSPVGRSILNEAEVLRVAERFGFRSYVLEELPLSAQIELFFDADAVIGVHGAGLTNLLFADRIDVVELHPTPTVFPHYYFLCQAMEHRYRFVCSNAPMRNSNFTVDTSALAERLSGILD